VYGSQTSDALAAVFDKYVAVSDAVHYTDIGLWKANRNSYAVYRLVLFSVTLSDPNYPKPTHSFHIWYRFWYHCNGWR